MHQTLVSYTLHVRRGIGHEDFRVHIDAIAKLQDLKPSGRKRKFRQLEALADSHGFLLWSTFERKLRQIVDGATNPEIIKSFLGKPTCVVIDESDDDNPMKVSDLSEARLCQQIENLENTNKSLRRKCQRLGEATAESTDAESLEMVIFRLVVS